MPNATFTEVSKAIRKALNDIHEQQRTLDAERRMLEEREQMLTNTLQGLSDSNGNGRKRPRRQQPSEPTKTVNVADKHLKAVREFVTSQPDGVRQADIGQSVHDVETGKPLNSGTVSLALKRLEQEGLVEQRDKLHGSRVWAEPTKRRTTVVTPGEGIQEGRLAV